MILNRLVMSFRGSQGSYHRMLQRIEWSLLMLGIALLRGTALVIADGKCAGTAFFVSRDGTALTCRHVVAGAEHIEVRYGGAVYLAEYLRERDLPGVDIAWLKTGVTPPLVLPIAANTRVQPGDDVCTVGYPGALNEDLLQRGGVFKGNIANVLNERNALYTKAITVGPGNSGAPLYHVQTRRVIGLVSTQYKKETYDGLGFATQITEATTRWLARLGQEESDWDHLTEESEEVTAFEAASVSYARETADRYRQGPLAKHFLRPRLAAAGDQVVPYEALLRTLLGTRTDMLVVLGDFGAGKSVLAEYLTYELLQNYAQHWESAVFPVLARLKNYKTGEDIQDFLLRTINGRYGLGLAKGFLLKLERVGRLLFVLDGFDEMSPRIDRESLRSNLLEIHNLVADGSNAVLLTCRKHFFHTSIDEDLLHASSKYELLPWNTEEVRAHLQSRLPSTWNQVYERIGRVHNLSELARTPLFLDMIIDSLSSQFESVRGEINSAKLYELYSNRWFSELVIRPGAVLGRREKRSFVRELACRLFFSSRQAIDGEELQDWVRERFKLGATQELENFTNDITTCSFLRRNKDTYEFAHLSFMEYFVADMLAEELLNGRIGLFSRRTLRTEIYIFCAEILRNRGATISYKPIMECDDVIALANLVCIIYRIGDVQSFQILAALFAQPVHPVVRSVLVTSLGAYSPEQYVPVFVRQFEAETNTINRRAMQIQLRYSDTSTVGDGLRSDLRSILAEEIELREEDAASILMGRPDMVSAFEHGLRFHRLNLDSDPRWIIAVNCAWLLTAYGDKEIIPTLRYYLDYSKVEQVRETSRECLRWFESHAPKETDYDRERDRASIR
jgi:Trypsin-like peptidase domain/NACHT domain